MNLSTHKYRSTLSVIPAIAILSAEKYGFELPTIPTKEQFLDFSRDPASAVRMQVGSRSVLVYPWTIFATSNLIQFHLLDLYSIMEYLYYIPNFCSRKGTWRKTPSSFRHWLIDDQSGNSSYLVLSTVYSITNDISHVLSKLWGPASILIRMLKSFSAPIVRLGTIPMKGTKKLDVDRLHHSYPSRSREVDRRVH